MTYLSINRGQYYWQVTDTSGDVGADMVLRYDPTKHLTQQDVIQAMKMFEIWLDTAAGRGDFTSNNL
jgi:hypothetical protein